MPQAADDRLLDADRFAGGRNAHKPAAMGSPKVAPLHNPLPMWNGFLNSHPQIREGAAQRRQGSIETGAICRQADGWVIRKIAEGYMLFHHLPSLGAPQLLQIVLQNVIALFCHRMVSSLFPNTPTNMDAIRNNGVWNCLQEARQRMSSSSIPCVKYAGKSANVIEHQLIIF